MDLRQLRYLVALADERSFTRAAAREHVAQPALSQAIRRLEAEVGLPLAERTTRTVRMTHAGELLADRGRRILAEVAGAELELRALRGLTSGRIVVGAMHTLGPVDVAGLLSRFHGLYPNIELTVREASSEELAEMLRVGELDLAFLSVTERIESHELELRRLLWERLVVALPRSHPLAGRSEVRIDELREDQFISYRRGARLRELLESAARGEGFEPAIALESNASDRIRRLVASGMGVAVLPASEATKEGDEIAVAALVAPEMHRDITLAWREGNEHSPAASAFIELTLTVTRSSDAADRPAGD